MRQDKLITVEDIQYVHNSISAKHPDIRLYALVDHGGMPGLIDKLNNIKRNWISLFEGSKEENALSVAPILFSIPADYESFKNRDFLTWLGKKGTYTSSVVLIASPLNIEELARRLKLRLDAMLPDDMAIMLRFFDPRVFEELSKVLLPEQKELFLSVGYQWWYIDRRGQLQNVASVFLDSDMFEPPLVLDDDQESALIDASEPDQVAQMLTTSTPNEYTALQSHARFDFVQRHMKAARDLNIAATHELAFYCALALMYGEDFAAKPDWHTTLQEVKKGQITLQQAVERIEIEQ